MGENTTEPSTAETERVRVQQLEAEIEGLYKKYDLYPQVVEEFPMYRILPIEVQLAIQVISKHNVFYKVIYKKGKAK